MKAVLSLGGNIGNAADAIRNVAEVLAQHGFKNIELSPLYKTAPLDCEPGTPDFINAVIVGDWSGSPEDLLLICRKLETVAGRPQKRAKNSPRVLDIDIILLGNEIRKSPDLTLPHPLAAKRLFVMQPLCDIYPDACFPDSNLTATELLTELRSTLTTQEQYIEKIINPA